MTMNFRVGQKVVCVEDRFSARCRIDIPALPVKGQTYTVRGVYGHANGQMIWLEEIANPLCVLDDVGGAPIEPCWPSCRFRPAVDRKTDISTFTKILDDVNAGRVREVTRVS
jgi:hypothetical protein